MIDYVNFLDKIMKTWKLEESAWFVILTTGKTVFENIT